MSLNEHDELLRPREVATVFGVRTSTIARWAREGRLSAVFTPGGHRRYRRSDLQALAVAEAGEYDEPRPTGEEGTETEGDAVRLYEMGWSIRRVADEFGTGYGVMRRILRRHVSLRGRGGFAVSDGAGDGATEGATGGAVEGLPGGAVDGMTGGAVDGAADGAHHPE